MKQLLLSTLLLFGMIQISCKKESGPTSPGGFSLTGEWTGTIEYYFSNYPLSLRLDRVINDSLAGQVIIGFANTPDTVPIQSALYFVMDSLYFDLNRGGWCSYRSMWGRVINPDSLAGHWSYRCVNDPPMASAWTARRRQ